MKNYLILVLILISNVMLDAQNNYQEAIDRFLKDENLEYANISIHLIDAQSGNTIGAANPKTCIVPASALKLVTTATALDILGPNYEFKTELLINGPIENGILQGDVIIKGFGDPTLGSAEWRATPSFEKIIEQFKLALQQRGVKKINGYIIGDDSYFSTSVTPKSWQLNDLGNYYAAGVHGLNIHDNLYYLRFKQTSTLGATPPVHEISPSVDGIQFINEIESDRAGTGDNAYIYGAPFTYLKFIRGTIPVGSGLFKIKGAVPDPPLFFAQLLERSFRRSGVTSTKGSTTSRLMRLSKERFSGEGTLITTHQSPKLAAIIQRTLYKSFNLYAEALLHHIGKVKQQEGDTDNGIEGLKEYWENKGLNTKGVFLADGSGLSTRNAVSAQFMTALLQKQATSEHFQVFLDAIPLAGRTGSLKNRFKGSPAEGRLYAKSGTLGKVRSYAGYIKNSRNQLLCFAVSINNYEGSGSAMRRKLDQLLIQFCK